MGQGSILRAAGNGKARDGAAASRRGIWAPTLMYCHPITHRAVLGSPDGMPKFKYPARSNLDGKNKERAPMQAACACGHIMSVGALQRARRDFGLE